MTGRAPPQGDAGASELDRFEVAAQQVVHGEQERRRLNRLGKRQTVAAVLNGDGLTRCQALLLCEALCQRQREALGLTRSRFQRERHIARALDHLGHLRDAVRALRGLL
ncbi:MAG: hypothetical protein ACK559_13705, partial [bacterium]